MKRILSILFFLSIYTMVNAQVTDLNVSMKHGSIKIVDIDKDGRPDIIAGGETDLNNKNFRVFKNNGDGTYTAVPNSIMAATWGQLLLDDYDNDGNIDMLLAGEIANAELTKLYKGNGDGTFSVSNFSPVPTRQAALADFNNDGLVDIVLSPHNADGGVVGSAVYMNNGNGTFTKGFTFNTTLQIDGPTASTIDLNNDGLVDIIIGGWRDNFLFQYWKNNGDGSFSLTELKGLDANNYGSISWADYDGDGYFDVALNGNASNYTIYHNDGNFTFTKVQTLAYNQDWKPQGTSKWIDWNNDGYYDLVITGFVPSSSPLNRVTKIFLYNNGLFTESTDVIPGVNIGEVDALDLNGDNKADLALGGENNSGTGVCFVYQNTTPNANTPPSPPANISVTVGAKGSTFTWDAGSDAETPVGALTYNIFVRDGADKSWKVYPKADITTGKRYVSEHGNAFLNKSWTINNLDTGKVYEVGVQSIDASYTGSPFTIVKFKNVAKVDSIFIDVRLNIMVEEDQMLVNSVVSPSNAQNKNCKFTVENLTGEASITSNGRTGVLYAAKAGTVRIVVEALDGSMVKADRTILILNPLTSVGQLHNAQGCYPNPTTGKVYFGKTNPIQCVVSSLDGRIWMITSLTKQHSGVDISSLPKGLYLFTLSYGDHTERIKIIKE